VGELLNTKFVAAHQQAGDFQVVVRDGEIVQKNGGNVASYFCTPDGRVVNAVLGPVAANELLREAQWAVDVYEEAGRLSLPNSSGQVAKAHALAASERRGRQSQQIHRLLAERPLVGLDEIYRSVFTLLGEGERARGLGSPEVVAIEKDNERLREESQRLRERLNGTGSAKALALQDINNRLSSETQQLRAIDAKRTAEEAAAFNWLRTAVAYLESGKPEDGEAARARLKVILERYPNTKAAETAAELLIQSTARITTSR
jgi:hypothetical protein